MQNAIGPCRRMQSTYQQISHPHFVVCVSQARVIRLPVRLWQHRIYQRCPSTPPFISQQTQRLWIRLRAYSSWQGHKSCLSSSCPGVKKMRHCIKRWDLLLWKMHVAKIVGWNLWDQIQSQALMSLEKSLNLTVPISRKVFRAYFMSCVKSMLTRTLVNLFLWRMQKKIIFHIKSACERSIYAVCFKILVFKEPKRRRQPRFSI